MFSSYKSCQIDLKQRNGGGAQVLKLKLESAAWRSKKGA